MCIVRCGKSDCNIFVVICQYIKKKGEQMVAKIKALCEAKHISIAELQRRVGINKDAIRRWDTNKPSVDVVKRVADILETTVDYLVS